MNVKTLNFYSNYPSTDPANIEIVKINTINSRGDTVSAEMKYPTDFPDSTIYQTMVAKNIITPVVTTTQKVNGVQVNYTRKRYYQWFSSGAKAVIEPEIITVKKIQMLKNRDIHYYSYDTTGNPLEVSKENDIRISYIWDYQTNFPIAEVKKWFTSRYSLYFI